MRMLLGLALCAGLAIGQVTTSGVSVSGSVRHKTTRPLTTLQSNYLALGRGVLFDWNMPTFTQQEIATANVAVNTFAPTGLNIDQWLSNAVKVGAQYVFLTTKHHDGFALWPTAYAVATFQPYSIAQTTWYASNGSPDVVGLFCSKARALGLKVVLYFSIWDLTYEARSGTTAASGTMAYIAMIKAQLTELLSNYGPLAAIWLDGWGWNSAVGFYSNIPYATIHDHIKQLQPECLIIENSHTGSIATTDIVMYEQTANGAPASANTTISGTIERMFASNWFWKTASATDIRQGYFPASYINELPSRTSNYEMTFEPTTAGVLDSPQTALADSIVRYLTANLAIGKTVTVSSNYDGVNFPGSKVTDGRYVAVGSPANYWASAASDLSPYAELDLGSAMTITTVEAFNRNDCCLGRFRDLTITVYNASHVAVYTSATINPANALSDGTYTNGPAMVSVSPGVSGRYVRIARTSTGSTADQAQLTVAELGVF